MSFDQFVAVDWSASAKRNKGKNSIWIAACDIEGALHLENPNTRQAAMDRIESLLEEASAAGRRVLSGFDFSFGYPKGTARMLTGRAGWEAVWERIAEEIDDRLDNRNDSFQAAARLNGCFEGEGPFWGLPAGRQIEGLLPTRPREGWGQNLPPRLRYSEGEVPRAQEVWKLFYPGSVGRQALTGIARLERLRRRRSDVRVWPFETLEEDRRHVLAEIYPSLIEPCSGNGVLDARQVAAVALSLRDLSRSGRLDGYLNAPNGMPDRVRREEGAILGMHDQEGFRAVARGATLDYRVDGP